MSEIKIISIKNAPKVPFNFDGRILHSSENLEVIHLVLKAGEKMALHIQPFDVIFYVISGEGTLEAEQQQLQGDPGTCIHVLAGIRRAWKNTGKEEFRVLVIKDLK